MIWIVDNLDFEYWKVILECCKMCLLLFSVFVVIFFNFKKVWKVNKNKVCRRMWSEYCGIVWVSVCNNFCKMFGVIGRWVFFVGIDDL